MVILQYYMVEIVTPIPWSNPVDRLMLGPDMLKELELTVKQVQGNLKTTQDR